MPVTLWPPGPPQSSVPAGQAVTTIEEGGGGVAFHHSDPRTTLSKGEGPSEATDVPAPTFVSFEPAAEQLEFGGGSRSWAARGQNVIVEYSILQAGDVLEGADEPDESVVLAPHDHVAIEVTWQGCTESLESRGVIAVPPGRCTVTARARSEVIRLTTPADATRAASAINADDYRTPRAGTAPLTLWPQPRGDARLRRYALRDAIGDPARFGNIYRTRAFMINFLHPDVAPRDPDRLSPHVHADFEQLSFVVSGTYVHHIRTPWTPRSSTWRPDIHRRIGAPSVTIIPPGAIHTSQSVGGGVNALIDIFAPPREDFSARPGWVLNAADYPAPQTDPTS